MIDALHAAAANISTQRFAGSSRAHDGEIASVWPEAKEFGSRMKKRRSRCSMAMDRSGDLGEPVISRLVSLEHSHEIKPEWCRARNILPASDGWSAARIEEEL